MYKYKKIKYLGLHYLLVYLQCPCYTMHVCTMHQAYPYCYNNKKFFSDSVNVKWTQLNYSEFFPRWNIPFSRCAKSPIFSVLWIFRLLYREINRENFYLWAVEWGGGLCVWPAIEDVACLGSALQPSKFQDGDQVMWAGLYFCRTWGLGWGVGGGCTLPRYSCCRTYCGEPIGRQYIDTTAKS